MAGQDLGQATMRATDSGLTFPGLTVFQTGHCIGATLAKSSPPQARALARRILAIAPSPTAGGEADFEIGMACGVTSTIGMRRGHYGREKELTTSPSTTKRKRTFTLTSIGKPCPTSFEAIANIIALEILDHHRRQQLDNALGDDSFGSRQDGDGSDA